MALYATAIAKRRPIMSSYSFKKVFEFDFPVRVRFIDGEPDQIAIVETPNGHTFESKAFIYKTKQK